MRSTGHDRASWQVLLLLVLAVFLPTAGVLWFMNAAVKNERLLVRQRLTDAYKANLKLVRDRVADQWDRQMRALDEAARPGGAAAYGRIVREGLADSAVIFNAAGRLAYPAPGASAPAVKLDQAAWDRAGELEFRRKDLGAAARAYSEIAALTQSEHEAARALGAQSRCLLGAGLKPAVVDLVRREFGAPRFRQAVDSSGRVIAIDQELLAIQILGAARAGGLLERLAARLADYANPAIGADQRRFTLRELRSLGVPVPQLEAEELAARWVEQVLPKQGTRETVLRPGPLEGIWQMATVDGRAVALYRMSNLEKRLGALLPAGDGVRLLGPGTPSPAGIEAAAISDRLAGWRLALPPRDDALEAAEAEQRVASYFWMAALVVASICILTWLAARALGKQMRLARMKNDLVATVSHELKTPLTSMRLLVDTLLESSDWDRARAREYLELIAAENSRLSRLIDNFLTFSRMERNKQRFEFRQVTADDIVQPAMAAMGERLRAPACDFALEVTPRLPAFPADADSVVTVIVNLLDNACKYTPADKRIRLRAFAENGSVCFAVEDNGIGLSARDRSRIFDRFYQVDQSLARQAGGCGLGLSIVDYIVRAHHGRIDVRSEPGRGSTFTVVLPRS